MHFLLPADIIFFLLGLFTSLLFVKMRRVRENKDRGDTEDEIKGEL